MEQWKDAVAVVTGASEGIGEAIVRKLAAGGMRVVAMARRLNMLEAIEKDVNSKFGTKRVWSKTCDVSDEESVKEAFEWVQKNVGPVSVLVNNAAVFEVQLLTELDIASAKKTVNTNLMGVLSCTQQYLSAMKSSGLKAGHVIDINSIAGHRDVGAMPGIAIYSATKHALTFLNNTLRKELATANINVRVTSVSPGLVKTKMSNWFSEKNPNAPAITPCDVADAVIYALSAPFSVNISEVMIQPTGSTY